MGRTLVLAALLLLAPAAAPQDGAPAAKTVKDLFKGKVVSVKGRRIEVSYDFADAAQAEDWAPAYPFVRPAASGGFRVDGKALRGDGYAGWRLKAVFDGDMKLSATLSSEDARDFGALALDEMGTQFNLYSLSDTTFSALDRKNPLQNMITTFQPAGKGPGGNTEWRYVKTSYEPRIGTAPFEMTIRKKGVLNEFRFGAGRLAGEDKETKVGPRLAAAFFTLGARVVISKASVSGVLDAEWLKDQGVLFEDTVPEDPDPLEPEKGDKGKDPAPAPGPDAKAPPPTGEWPILAGKVLNGSLPRDEREKAADALIESKEKRAVRPMIDAMYRDDDAIARELGNKVFKGITGKDAGYKADLPKDARVKIMPRVWTVWYELKEQIDREDAKKAKEK
jgi:hypothetical protein